MGKSKAKKTSTSSNRSSRSNRSKCWARIYHQELAMKAEQHSCVFVSVRKVFAAGKKMAYKRF